ncbi:MAG: heavy metal translocating P-type ATPase, partial [Candidatus Caldatribacteriaceae bacterium]
SSPSRQELTKIVLPFLLLLGGAIASRIPNLQFLAVLLYLSGYFSAGWKTFRKFWQNLKRGQFFDENFLMVLASGGALALREFAEAATVMSLFNLGEFLEEFALRRSHQFIGQLLSSKTEYIHLQQGGRWVDVHLQEVKAGDIFRVNPGEKILLDGVVLEGSSHLDTSSLTGESLPLPREKGDTILSGAVNLEGSLILRATKDYENSTINTIVQILKSALQKKAPAERFITRFARFYTSLVVFFACSLLLFPLFTGTFNPSSLYRVLTVLMISCPCALVLSIPLGFLAGIGKSAQTGVLIKGSVHLEDLARLTKIFFDKTGTLTQGQFRVKEVRPSDGQSREALLKLASTVSSRSSHPLAQAIRATRKEDSNPHFDHYQETPGAGILARAGGQEILFGNERFLKNHGVSLEYQKDLTGATVHLAREGKYLGYIVLEDTVKDDAIKTIAALRENGIETYLLSGDKKENVARVARETGIEHFFAELLPQEKVAILEKFLAEKKPGERIAFVGDGMNDAPALARADLGIAMGKRGIDIAVETADVVLMTDELSKLKKAIEIARQTRGIIWQNIGFSIGMKALFLVLATLGMANLWEAVFADVGIMALAILNSLRIMR